MEGLTNEVFRELLPGHPVMWDKYNLYEMTPGLGIAVDVSFMLKQP